MLRRHFTAFLNACLKFAWKLSNAKYIIAILVLFCAGARNAATLNHFPHWGFDSRLTTAYSTNLLSSLQRAPALHRILTLVLEGQNILQHGTGLLNLSAWLILVF